MRRQVHPREVELHRSQVPAVDGVEHPLRLHVVPGMGGGVKNRLMIIIATPRTQKKKKTGTGCQNPRTVKRTTAALLGVLGEGIFG